VALGVSLGVRLRLPSPLVALAPLEVAPLQPPLESLRRMELAEETTEAKPALDGRREYPGLDNTILYR